ncbi:ABC transporter ATP-binding protein [Alicyclobacillus fastidiosus]|uniref:ABC transporter ATP-binding protein n=1 Tax=Alicyclobacillus fastidiosus TaxID=392011 RepID=A0ABV5AES4_9BACL|nr:ABC transporter ATP-binding protein [Alicyclobacillus fastidiosus]WEH08608.1 ABC transporter ATP-binding protein [Alicyclobacillus fastidiosus]
MSQEEAVYCRGVSKRYGQKYALNDLNLSLPKGCVVGVLGPNGSGKSTLFRALTNLTRPDSGEVRVLGRRPNWKTNEEIAYLPDRARWYPEQSVQQAFEWATRLLPGFDRAFAEQLASTMKLDLDMRTAGMSRGQEARLMLILCIARDVPLTILDEPFTGIDAISREQIIQGLIEHMSTGDRTMLVSTHEIYEAEPLFDHAVFMNEGQVQLSGDAERLRGEYGSMHTILNKLYR